MIQLNQEFVPDNAQAVYYDMEEQRSAGTLSHHAVLAACRESMSAAGMAMYMLSRMNGVSHQEGMTIALSTTREMRVALEEQQKKAGL